MSHAIKCSVALRSSHMENTILGNPLLDEMKRTDYLKYNTIYLCDEVDRDSQVMFCRQLKRLCERELAKKPDERKHIKIIISSNGGSLYDFFAMASLMEHYQEEGIIIETHCYGYAHSAGAKLLMLGSKGHRYASRYSRIIVHQIQTYDFGHATLQDKLTDAEALKRDWETVRQIIKSHSKLTDEELDMYTHCNRDFTYDGPLAIEKGIVDKLI